MSKSILTRLLGQSLLYSPTHQNQLGELFDPPAQVLHGISLIHLLSKNHQHNKKVQVMEQKARPTTQVDNLLDLAGALLLLQPALEIFDIFTAPLGQHLHVGYLFLHRVQLWKEINVINDYMTVVEIHASYLNPLGGLECTGGLHNGQYLRLKFIVQMTDIPVPPDRYHQTSANQIWPDGDHQRRSSQTSPDMVLL